MVTEARLPWQHGHPPGVSAKAVLSLPPGGPSQLSHLRQAALKAPWALLTLGAGANRPWHDYLLWLSPQEDKEGENLKAPRAQKVYKIVLAGDAAVGKSSFLMRLCKNEFRGDTSATLGMALFSVDKGKMAFFSINSFFQGLCTQINISLSLSVDVCVYLVYRTA